MSQNIVNDWLRFLDLEEYCEGFLENGYDDLETVKLIEREDLIAIGVSRSDHQEYLLASVRILRERGAAWVYLVFTDQTNGASEFVEDRHESNTVTYYGSDGTDSYKSSSCLHSDETYSSSSSERKPVTASGVIQQYTDATGSKRFILNVEVTPEHKPRPALPHAHTDNRIHRIGIRKDPTVIINKDDIETDPDTVIKTKNDIKERQRRSIFSQLGQWLCQGGGGAGREGCYSKDGPFIHSDFESKPGAAVISVSSPEGKIHYTPMSGPRIGGSTLMQPQSRMRLGIRGEGDQSVINTMTRTGTQTGKDYKPASSSKLWTPLIPHKQYNARQSRQTNVGSLTMSRQTDNRNLYDVRQNLTPKVNTSIRYCQDLGRGSESQV